MGGIRLVEKKKWMDKIIERRIQVNRAKGLGLFLDKELIW